MRARELVRDNTDASTAAAVTLLEGAARSAPFGLPAFWRELCRWPDCAAEVRGYNFVAECDDAADAA